MSLPPGTRAKSVQLSVTKTAVTLGLKGREGPVLKVTELQALCGKKSVSPAPNIFGSGKNSSRAVCMKKKTCRSVLES